MKLLGKMDAADVEKLFVAALHHLVNGVGREQFPFNAFKIIDRMRKMSTSLCTAESSFLLPRCVLQPSFLLPRCVL